ncbi:hypothetical protein TRVA0_007S01046 [Trichomonascus vanleenenianus]|uniref:uncharacterized protein n=1 Tax=Trichomonascus vanleenenianus TaxID=2268995 RepID=UPI003EC9947D
MRLLQLFVVFYVALCSALLVVPSVEVDETLQVAVKHKASCKKDHLLVSVVREQRVRDSEHRQLAQGNTNYLFRFDLNQTHVVAETVPGLPLKLYPVTRGKLSTYATFMPTKDEGHYRHSAVDGPRDDDVEQRREPLWGADDGAVVDVVLEVENAGERYVTIKTFVDGQLRGLDSVVLPPPHHHHPHGKDRLTKQTVKDVIMHYYGKKGYSKVQEVYEFLHAAVVGFFTPIVLFGVLSTAMFMLVFIVCTWRQRPISLPLDDEKSRPPFQMV